jgi:hypothetical protein
MPSAPSHQSSSIAVGLVRKNKAARQKIRKGRNRAAMRKALREKYACGTISPNNVITTAEKKNAPSPARIESDSSVRNTLAPTLPQMTVAST